VCAVLLRPSASSRLPRFFEQYARIARDICRYSLARALEGWPCDPAEVGGGSGDRWEREIAKNISLDAPYR
jgi:hypothetical protein